MHVAALNGYGIISHKDAWLCVPYARGVKTGYLGAKQPLLHFWRLLGRTYGIARGASQKTNNGHKVIIEPSEPYESAKTAIFTVILAKQGTSEGFWGLNQTARHVPGMYRGGCTYGGSGQEGHLRPCI